MQKTMFKTLCIFTLVFFVMSMTGAACSKSNNCATNARDDTFTVDTSKTSKSYNVLSNDKGCGIKVDSKGYLTTSKGGKVYMKSNGSFKYIKPVSCSKISDSFTYKSVNKYGKYDTAKVTMKLKCTSCSSCSSGTCPSRTCSSCSSCAN
jgi:hypothetical protein